MRAIVFVSSVANPEEKLILEGDHFKNIPDDCIANDFDLIAVEAAVRLKEQGIIDEIVVFCLGPALAHVQKALAMGADRAIFGECDNRDLTPQIVVDTALAHIDPDDATIYMLGKLGVNFESHCVPQMLANRLSCPCVCSVYKIEKADKRWQLHCEDDVGIPIFEAEAPFVMTTELRLAEPRFPSLPNIIKARRKPIESVQIEATSQRSQTLSLEMAADAQRSCKWLSADELITMVKGLES